MKVIIKRMKYLATAVWNRLAKPNMGNGLNHWSIIRVCSIIVDKNELIISEIFIDFSFTAIIAFI